MNQLMQDRRSKICNHAKLLRSTRQGRHVPREVEVHQLVLHRKSNDTIHPVGLSDERSLAILKDMVDGLELDLRATKAFDCTCDAIWHRCRETEQAPQPFEHRITTGHLPVMETYDPLDDVNIFKQDCP